MWVKFYWNHFYQTIKQSCNVMEQISYQDFVIDFKEIIIYNLFEMIVLINFSLKRTQKFESISYQIFILYAEWFTCVWIEFFNLCLIWRKNTKIKPVYLRKSSHTYTRNMIYRMKFTCIISKLMMCIKFKLKNHMYKGLCFNDDIVYLINNLYP